MARNTVIIIISSIVVVFTFSSASKILDEDYDKMLQDLLSFSVDTISVQEAHDCNTVIFLDTRTRAEYNVSHIKNAVWVGYDSFRMTKKPEINKMDSIVVYCSVGYRSEKIGDRLKAMGYTQVFNLYGGIFQWKNLGFPVYDETGETEQIHAYDILWSKWLVSGEKVY